MLKDIPRDLAKYLKQIEEIIGKIRKLFYWFILNLKHTASKSQIKGIPRWLGLCTSTAKSPGSIAGWGAKILKATHG